MTQDFPDGAPGAGLPAPDPAARALGRALARHIRERIRAAGGSLDFARFMELALYAPGLGYYSAGQRKFGAAGDFVTAPEISSLFGACVARQCAQVLRGLGGGDVLEFGAGSGRLAVDVLAELARLDALPGRYLILEVSADLRDRQRRRIRAECGGLAGRVEWLDTLDGLRFEGVMLGNEVLDALPVRRFVRRRRGVAEQRVCVRGDGFGWLIDDAPDDALSAAVGELERTLGGALPDGYVSEINLRLGAWVSALSGALARGVILLSDYGCSRREYYLPERRDGTLQCHYRHRVHGDPLVRVGLQDITADVDFSAVAQAALDAGLDVAGYTTQAHFLLGCGLDELLADALGGDPARAADTGYMRLAQQAARLTLPGDMGERFKCIALARDCDQALRGFSVRDFRSRL